MLKPLRPRCCIPPSNVFRYQATPRKLWITSCIEPGIQCACVFVKQTEHVKTNKHQNLQIIEN